MLLHNRAITTATHHRRPAFVTLSLSRTSYEWRACRNCTLLMASREHATFACRMLLVRERGAAMKVELQVEIDAEYVLMVGILSRDRALRDLAAYGSAALSLNDTS